jgi:hypothetical protein
MNALSKMEDEELKTVDLKRCVRPFRLAFAIRHCDDAFVGKMNTVNVHVYSDSDSAILPTVAHSN